MFNFAHLRRFAAVGSRVICMTKPCVRYHWNELRKRWTRTYGLLRHGHALWPVELPLLLATPCLVWVLVGPHTFSKYTSGRVTRNPLGTLDFIHHPGV